jgi:trk system potassium uptake protein TrkH
MIHFKIISRILGLLLFIEALFMLVALGVSVYYDEHIIPAYIYAIATTLAAGALLLYCGRGKERNISRKDGYIVVASAWIIFSIFGSILYLISGYIPSVSNAFFETISGFTTTGATILDNIEEFPPSLLLWRSMTHWIGGLGIVFFTVALLPVFGMGDIHLFAA